MKTGTIEKKIEEKLNNLLSGNVVKDLCKQDVSEYERGKIAGKIEVLMTVIRELQGKEK